MVRARLWTAAGLAVIATAVPVGVAVADQQAETGVVQGFHYMDRNANGVRDEGEPGGSNAVGVYTLDGTSVATVGTGPDGWYHVPDLAPGEYQVGINPIGYQMTTPTPVRVTVTAGGVAVAHFGKLGGDMSGLAWHDLNADGQRQPDEPLIRVPIWLGRWQVPTDEQGRFFMPNQGTSTYAFRFVPPAGMTFSPYHVGDPATDSDVPPDGYARAVIELVDGRINNVLNIDAGLVTVR
ncbi:SdrD B-like protein [Herbihabitans rhizosphaerae]|uniref:SdrD B-like protein n=1 Tax=Herbihabitans rhizosphaerae TaxID=1872711 RepID=A0A4Q7KF73_9PSEU|nr:SdrD B-like domain-containing protein [Herbihabitans rhizosphaerae]RZS32751.1 SdrD B-like protein [Herbihabitans rhizosphaerae]